uniref:Small ribosomal subunit protein mS23 n=1 Tax=Paramormyrops kingsleyae TaxID=1676925 RepID=A0A3B3SEB9_9TELE|nr:28S ribosomal protein S23, mitochondrial [Paramormyrops kingsleyae]
MAGSRLEKFGTIFTRMGDLIRGGVVKAKDVPVWYDVYAAFPPKKDPLYVKPMAKRYGKVTVTVPEIFYKEDEVRAKFYAVYGTGPRAFELSKPNFISTCQRFVEKYGELEKQGEVPEEALFEETGRALLAEGVMLRRRGGPSVAPENRDPVLGMRLKDMLSELQTDTAGKAQAEGEQVQGESTGTPH